MATIFIKCVACESSETLPPSSKLTLLCIHSKLVLSVGLHGMEIFSKFVSERQIFLL